MITFSDWINKYNLNLGLEYISFDWTKNLDTEAYDIQCGFTRNGKVFIGRGTEANRDLAIVKSTAEMLERYFLDQIDEADSSNGVAVHTESELAELNALCELLERDSFFCHYLTKTPFKEIEISRTKTSGLREAVIALLESRGAEIRIAELQTDSRFASVICSIFGVSAQVPFGMTLGTSTKLKFEEAIESAFIEAARSAIAYLLYPQLLRAERDSKSCSSFSRPEDHLRVGLDPDYAIQFRDMFFRRSFSELSSLDSGIDFDKISISSFKPELIDGDARMSPPLFLARASSNSLINLFFGEFIQEEEKLGRLSAFLGRPISPQDINYTIHPFA